MNLGEVLEEGLNIIFRLQGVNYIYNSSSLLSLLLLEIANISRLDKIGLIRRELYKLNIVYFSLKNKLRILIILSKSCGH